MEQVEIVIVGSGFAGLGAAIQLKRSGRHDFIVLERGDDVGGTWRDNDSPGCRCDVPSHLYSFSFAANPEWSNSFSSQEEIWRYLRTVAERHGVIDRIRFDCEVRACSWDDEAKQWVLRTSQGTMTADVVLAATGPFSEPSVPHFEGSDSFRG